MRATQFAIQPLGFEENPPAPYRHTRWWERLTSHCARPDCPHRGHLWPTRIRKTSGVVFDGRWYCELACLRPFLEYRLQSLLSGFSLPNRRAHRLPLGLLLVNNGAISAEQLREALRLQREQGIGRLGDWFLQTGAITEDQLISALARQWGCPAFPLDAQHAHPSWSTLLPFPLLESARAVPAHASSDGRVLHLAFADRLDHTLLYAVEQMLDCRASACVAAGSAITNALTLLRRRALPEPSFDTLRDPLEMARTICNYADELRAVRLAVARATAHVWVRFYRRGAVRDLLFRALPEKNSYLSSGGPKASPSAADTRKDGASSAAEPL